MKKHAFRIGLVVTMLLGLMMISANAANCDGTHTGATEWTGAVDQVDLEDGGLYVLTGDVTMANRVRVNENATATICLDGYNLNYTKNSGDANYGFLWLGAGATLNICDCNSSGNGNGSISNTEGQTAKKATKLCILAEGKTVNMEAGTIKNFRVLDGLISMTGGTFNMKGGKIEGCDVASTSSGNGYLIYWPTSGKGGTFDMSGGEIGGNTLRRVLGAYSGSTGTFSISGGTISETEEVVSSTMLERFATFSITGGTFANTTNLTANDGYYFYDNGSTNTVYPDGYAPEPPADQEGEEIHGTGNGFWIPLTTAADFSSIEAGNKYYLAEDVTLNLDARYVFPVGECTLCLHGHSLKSGVTGNQFCINVPSGATVNLQDCDVNPNEGTICPADGNGSARGVLVSSGGTFNMSGGTITGFTNTGTSNGGGVQLNGGTMNMYGGTITGNHADSAKGGGVYVAAGGKLNIFDGTISDNTADLGGGIGAVGSTATVSVSGGTISNNEAKTTESGSSNGGGGIYIDGGTVNLTGGVLTGNSALNGGAVRANNYGKVNVSGDVKIYGNTADNAGAALCLYTYGTITISGGYIYSNVATPAAEADAYGAAIAVRSGKSSSKLTISGSACIGVDATGAAAANYCEGLDNSKGSIACVYDSSGTYTVTGGTFYVNEGDTLFGSYDNNGVTDTGAVQVTGGSFSKTIADRNLADGYHDYALAENESKVCPYVVDEKFAPSSVKLIVQDKNGFGIQFMVKQADVPGDIDDDYTVAFNNGETAEYSPDGAYYRYRFRGIAAKDMGDEVTLTFTNNDKVVSSTTFSIKEYATQVLETSSDDELKQAVSDMLRYGAAAQNYFQPDETAVTDGMDALLAEISNYTPANNADLTADTNELYKGSSLSLKNNIVLNLYFDSSVTGVSVGGEDMSSALEEYNGYKVVKFSNTDVLKLSTVGTELEIVITAGDADPITISDSVEAYVYRATQLAGEDKLTALCQAMMNFVVSANKCIPIGT